MVEMLRVVMSNGTGRPAAFGVPHGGKTGTTSDGRDAWFVGFTPTLVCGVWLGDDRNRRMHGISGGYGCGPAWRRIMQTATAARGGPGEFPKLGWGVPTEAPVKITGETATQKVKVCAITELLATPYCPETESRDVERGRAPKGTCTLHTAPLGETLGAGSMAGDAEPLVPPERPIPLEEPPLADPALDAPPDLPPPSRAWPADNARPRPPEPLPRTPRPRAPTVPSAGADLGLGPPPKQTPEPEPLVP
jgi:membrane peptidoglycan carboxypeptidase